MINISAFQCRKSQAASLTSQGTNHYLRTYLPAPFIYAIICPHILALPLRLHASQACEQARLDHYTSMHLLYSCEAAELLTVQQIDISMLQFNLYTGKAGKHGGNLGLYQAVLPVASVSITSSKFLVYSVGLASGGASHCQSYTTHQRWFESVCLKLAPHKL